MAESLMWSIKNGDIDSVKESLDKKPDDVNSQQSGRYPIHYAAEYGHVEVLEYLIQKGADVNKIDKFKLTPLLTAIFESNADAVKLLLKKGADKNGKGPDGKTYLECAETDEIKALLA